MNDKTLVVHITGDIGPTSSPLNNLYLFRLRQFGARGVALVANDSPKNRAALENLRDDESQQIHFTTLKSTLALRATLESIAAQREPEQAFVVHCHQPQHMIRAWFARQAFSELTSARLVLHVHNSYPHMKRGRKALINAAYMLADLTIFCGEAALESYPYRQLRGDSRVFVRNGIDTERIDSLRMPLSVGEQEATSIEDDCKTLRIVTIAKGNDWQKRVHATLKTVSDWDYDLVLTIVGPLSAKLRKEVSKDHRIQVAGTVSREEAWKIYLASHVVMSSSRYEGLPVGILEALYCGAVGVISDIEPHREIAKTVSHCHVVRSAAPADWRSQLSMVHAQLLDSNTRTEVRERLAQEVGVNYSLQESHEGLGRAWASIA